MTKTQMKNDKSINDIEFAFDNLIILLREDNNAGKFRSKHKAAVGELKYYIRSIKDKLIPKTDVTKLEW